MSRKKNSFTNKVRGAIKNDSLPPSIVYVVIEKSSFKLTVDLLEKVWREKTEDTPSLVLAFKRNDKEVFLLKCSISIEQRELN